MRADMLCPACGFTGLRIEFARTPHTRSSKYFRCPVCFKTGDRDTFTPRKKGVEEK